MGLAQGRGGPIEVIRPGDRVYFAPDEEHWHGAAPTRFMTHVAMLEVDDEGVSATWGEHVTDEEYGAAPPTSRAGEEVMASLIYTTIASLDGYVADEDGKFDWAEPDEEVHAFINDLERPVGTYLLGRRMYEVLAYWDDPPALDEQPSVVREFAEIWQAADKVVYSRTLEAARTARTRIERDFDPEAVRQLKAQSDRDVAVGGPDLAAQAIRAGLVDDYRMFVVPVVVGAGTQSLPRDCRIDLELLDNRRFRNGTVFLHYRTRTDGPIVGGLFSVEARRSTRRLRSPA